jgi:hypothetical protein
MSPSVILVAAESSGAASLNPWAVGGAIFVLLLILMGALLVFGAGRPHS